MQILFHLGAHCTDEGLLIRSILRNRAALAREGISVPGPGRYRELLGEVSTTLRGEDADDETEAMLLDAIRDDESADRVILSNEHFVCRDSVVLSSEGLYSKIGKAQWLSACFPGHSAEFALAVRNPATFLPDLVARYATTPEAKKDALTGVPLGHLSWTDVVRRLRDAVSGARIVVWCHEDTPFLWSEIMRELTQHDPFTRLEGALDVAERIISDEGMRRLTEFLTTRSDLTETRRRAAISAFLEAHAVPDEIETEVDLPGWTEDTLDDLTELYEEDVARLASLDGICFIEP